MTDRWQDQYPFTSHYLQVPGGRLHYVDEYPASPESLTGGSSRDSLPVLLCVHGNPTWSFYWRHIITAFRDRVRVVAIDHLGCGLSDKPQNYPYRLADHIGNLQRLIESLDLRNITLLAHDWGGAIGMGAAGRMPERFTRFGLFNTAAFRSDRCPWRIRVCRIPVLGAWGVRGLNLFAGAAITMATEKPERFTPAVRAGYLAPYDNYANRVAVHRFVQDIPLSEAHPSYGTLLEVEQGLGKFRDMPMLLAWGMRDWCFTPHFLERFREFFPQAEVHRFEDAGHYVIEDAHERIIPLVAELLKRPSATMGHADSGGTVSASAST
ncbi:MAG: alpha/beta fold hydrolase [Planctomycetales bacterium]|nr:alpha/beta fold hydrolase [Planctomycetales bacterium]MBN8627086.1 alpha/beta fold hydrolase [Planctomycetota bacterium]